MNQYRPPLRDMRFVLHELLGVDAILREIPVHADLDVMLIDQLLGEGGKFAAEVVFPLNQAGDRQGCLFDPATHAVRAPDGFRAAYQHFVHAGWPSLSCDPAHGGQGLPLVVSNAFFEMLTAANQSWTMYPGLSRSAYACVRAHGSADLKRIYLAKLVSGEWTGTMCLTEPHSGTDLGLLRTRAEAQMDGSYRLFGGKIFISSGEHDLADNIVHLVLARMVDAPAGTKGISLFLVPKFVPNADGTPGARNPIFCGAIAEKMGIHGNATCDLNLDGAAGWLVGEANKGLNAMFVMMNASRLGVGMQALGLTDTAYQNARAYAQERTQMRSLTGPKAPAQGADPIIVHPDVRRMLLTARAFAEGGRAFTSYVALQIDIEENHPNAARRSDAADEVALLTPIAKAFLSDNAWIATSEALQVYGGHGYIVDNGMEQYVRDARITMLYEGTNGVQALDLLGRKILIDRGATLRKFIDKIQHFVAANRLETGMDAFVVPLEALASELDKLTMHVAMKVLQNPDEAGAAAVPYLRVMGHLIFAYFFAQMAKIALAQHASDDDFYRAKLATARFYFARLLPETAMLVRQVRSGSAELMQLDDALV